MLAIAPSPTRTTTTPSWARSGTSSWGWGQAAACPYSARLYDPWAGVWLTREPLPGDAWRPRTWHRYAYVHANPLNFVDPYGFQCSYNILTGEEECFGDKTGMGRTLKSMLTFYQPVLPEGATPPFCLQESEDLLLRLYPGGKYGKGLLWAQGKWWHVFVPPLQLGRDRYDPSIWFYYNAPYEEPGWRTVGYLRGITHLPHSALEQVAVGLALSNPNLYPAHEFGPPVPWPVYQQLQFSEYTAWLSENELPEWPEPNLPPEDIYDALAGSIQIAASVIEASAFYLRDYQALLQTNEDATERRSIIQTFYVYQDVEGYQITPRYLSVSSTGEIQKWPLIYEYVSQSIERYPCWGSSTCYSVATPFQLP